MEGMTVEMGLAQRIEKALADRADDMRKNYRTADPFLPILYVNGFEDASEMVTRMILEAGAHAD